MSPPGGTDLPAPGDVPAPGGLPAPAIEVVELEPQHAAVLRSVVAPADFAEFIADALAGVSDTLARAGIAPAGPPFARYFGSGPDGLDVGVGLSIATPYLGRGPIVSSELPAGPAATATHIGPYDGLDAAWSALKAGIDALGRRRADDPWEIYFVGPGSGVEPDEWRTELVWPLVAEESEAPGDPNR